MKRGADDVLNYRFIRFMRWSARARESPMSRHHRGRLLPFGPSFVPAGARAGVMALLCALATTASADYRLDVGDRLRIAVYDRPDLSGEFTVRAPGKLSFPILGEVNVSGITAAELEKLLEERLGVAPNQSELSVNVEIIEHRPFFILGDVTRAGSYPYVNDMTVLHAIAIASGFKVVEGTDVVLRLEAWRAREKLRVLNAQLGTLLAREARLVAETAGREEIEFSDDLATTLGRERYDETVAMEREVLAERIGSLRSEFELLERSKSVFEEEIRAHRSQIAAHSRRGALVEEELLVLGRAGDSRVVPRTVILGLQRLGARIEGEKQELLAFISRAQAQLDNVDQIILARRNGRAVEVTLALQQTRDGIADKRIQIDETRRFLRDVTRRLPRVSAQPERELESRITIARKVDGIMVEIDATEFTPVLPGDIVKVPVTRIASPQSSH